MDLKKCWGVEKCLGGMPTNFVYGFEKKIFFFFWGGGGGGYAKIFHRLEKCWGGGYANKFMDLKKNVRGGGGGGYAQIF